MTAEVSHTFQDCPHAPYRINCPVCRALVASWTRNVWNDFEIMKGLTMNVPKLSYTERQRKALDNISPHEHMYRPLFFFLPVAKGVDMMAYLGCEMHAQGVDWHASISWPPFKPTFSWPPNVTAAAKLELRNLISDVGIPATEEDRSSNTVLHLFRRLSDDDFRALDDHHQKLVQVYFSNIPEMADFVRHLKEEVFNVSSPT